MITLKRQLFGIIVGSGIVIIGIIALSVNTLIESNFKAYIKKDIRKVSQEIVREIKEDYYRYGGWSQINYEEVYKHFEQDNFAVTILDRDKNIILGKGREGLEEKLQALQYSIFYQNPKQLLDMDDYVYHDIPVAMENDKAVAYVRIGYFPDLIFSPDDLLLQTTINQTILQSGALGLLCYVFIGFYVAGLIAKPVRAIAKTSVDLSEGRYESRYSRYTRIRELEHLRHHMNELAYKLENQDNLRKRLVGDISHELRTPLHILQSNLEAMIDGIYPMDEAQLHLLYQEVQRFANLLNGLEKLKNIEEDFTALKLHKIGMNTCIEEVWQSFKIVAQEKGIAYTANLNQTEGVNIMADSDAVKQILVNTLSNAFKFTDKGSIHIETERINKVMVRIVVEDTGIGIDKEDLPYVFERMYRADKSREQYEGTGLGLTIVKKLILLHGGTVYIESEKDKGTKVFIHLPLDE